MNRLLLCFAVNHPPVNVTEGERRVTNVILVPTHTH